MKRYLQLLCISCGFLAWIASANTPAPKRLVVLAPNLVELLYSLDAGAHIIATTEFADYPSDAQKIPRVANYIGVQLEKVMALQPDAVLYWRSGTPAADVRRMQQLGLTLIEFETETLEDIATQLLQLGEIVNKQAQAQQLAAEFLQKLATLRQSYAQQEKISVFYEIWDQPLSTIGASAWPSQQLALCGAHNIFSDLTISYPQVSLEQVLQADPALIIQPSSLQEKKNQTQWQAWPQLQAVKNNQIIQPDSDLLHRATLRTLTGVATLCREIAKSRQFYAQVSAGSGR